MNNENNRIQQEVNALIDQYRTRCLWFIKEDYYPAGREDTLKILDYIKRYGDREAFHQASTLATWLSPHSNEPSAV